jgi:hypothetical protein
MKMFAMIPALAAASVFSVTGLLAQEELTSSPLGAGQKVQLAQVQIANYNWSDVHLYLDQDGHVTSLGVVRSMETRQFKLPASAVGSPQMRIVAHLIAGSDYVSPTFMVWPDALVMLTLENALGQSTLKLVSQG